MKSILTTLTVVLLTSCVTKSDSVIVPQPVPALNIYQPSILVLPAGVPVGVEGGVYTPQTREVWHSDKRFRELERVGY
jgi:hypothetical protein